MINSTQEVTHTAEFSFQGNVGSEVDLHDGCELNVNVKPVVDVDYDKKWRGAEDRYIVCR